jgi:hypothetical protein
MRRSRLVATAGAVAALLVAGLPASASAQANATQVAIEPQAQIDFAGFEVQVGLKVRCEGGFGSVSVSVSQAPPESAFNTNGSGGKTVVCNGTQQAVAVTVFANFGQFDAGRALASATLFAPSGSDTEQRTITIVAA